MAKQRNVLSDAQRHLIDMYFTRAKFRKSGALRLAGYPHPYDHSPFQVQIVREEMDRRHERNRKRFAVSYDRVLEEIAKIAFANVGSYLEIREDGSMAFDFREVGLDELAAIGKVTVETYVDGSGDDAREVKRVRVEPYNKLAALEALMRHSGMSKEKGTSVEVNLVDAIRDARKRVGRSPEGDDGGKDAGDDAEGTGDDH